MNSKTFVDIIAIVVERFQPRSITTRFGSSTVLELCLINEEQLPVMLTLWNETVVSEGQNVIDAKERMPMVAATRINISNYNGMSLAARGSSSIIINPPYPQTQYLRDWRSRNHDFLAEVFEKKKYLKKSAPLPAIPYDTYSSIAGVIAANTNEKLWIKATARISDYKQSFGIWPVINVSVVPVHSTSGTLRVTSVTRRPSQTQELGLQIPSPIARRS